MNMKKLIVFGIVFMLVSAAGGSVALYMGYKYIRGQIPKIENIADYRAETGSKVYSFDGEMIAEFYDDNKRVIIPYDMIPKKLRQAFIAAEDSQFFSHYGINPVSMARAALVNLVKGKKAQGASTITQQLSKSFVGKEKTFTRKFKEAILATELERNLSKEEILYLYLNQVYLGSGAYGVEEAARTFFSKHVWELNLSEIATVAGTTPAPGKYSPLVSHEKALERRNYVLRRMFEEKYITKEEYEKAKSSKLAVNPQKELFLDKTPYFSERVRRHLQKTYGNEKLLKEGLTVYTTVDVRAEKMASEAVFMGLRSLALREGFTGALYKIDLSKDLDTYLKKHKAAFGEITEENMVRGVYYQGVVLETSKEKALIQVGTVKRPIFVADLHWAKPYNPTSGYAAVKDVSKVLAPGDIVMVHATDNAGTRDPLDHRNYEQPLPNDFFFVLEQIPQVQAAIIVKEPYSGYVKAIMGGYDFERSEFDRTTQAQRQPGSAMKPLFYAVGVDKYDITSATMLSNDLIASQDYQAMNHDKWEIGGEISVWEAIVHSMNLPAVHMLETIGLQNGLDGVRQLGIKSPLKNEYGVVLGSSEVNLDEMTDAFSHFPNGGKKPFTTYIRKVYDKDGNVLEDNTVYYDPYLTGVEKIGRMIHFAKRKEEQNLSPEAAYIMTKLLQGVITNGTGGPAASIMWEQGREIAGKTGTTNDYIDAWFIGFSPEVIAGVWVGNDQPSIPLGLDETGGKAALPIWKDFMGRYLKNYPKSSFKKPESVVSAVIDKATGLIGESGITMYFKEGTIPEKTVDEKEEVDPETVTKGVF